MPKRFFLKSTALTLAILFSAHEICLAAASAGPTPASTSPIQASRRPILSDVVASPSRIEVPAGAVRFRDARAGLNDRLVILIEDAHANYEGQKNVAAAIRSLTHTYPIRTVLLEGGDGRANLDALTPLVPARDLKIGADRLLRQGVLNGPEHLSLTEPMTADLIGMENEAHYRAALLAYARAARLRPAAERELDRALSALEAFKNRLYPETLLRYDAARSRGSDAFAPDHFGRLWKLAAKAGVSLDAYPNLRELQLLQRAESGIDFAAVHREQEALAAELRAGNDAEEAAQILERIGQAAQAGELRHAILRLLDLSAASDRYPSLSRYAEYLDSFRGIRWDDVFTESEVLEAQCYRDLLPDLDARRIAVLDIYLRLLRKAHDLHLSSREFALLQSNRKDFASGQWMEFLTQKAEALGIRDLRLPAEISIDRMWPSVRAFYSLADLRDRAFLSNARRAFEGEADQAVILVAGGYHTEHLKELLSREGYGWVVLTPHITSETDRAVYENILLLPLGPKAASAARPSAASVRHIAKALLLSGSRLAAAFEPQLEREFGASFIERIKKTHAELEEEDADEMRLRRATLRDSETRSKQHSVYQGVVLKTEAIRGLKKIYVLTVGHAGRVGLPVFGIVNGCVTQGHMIAYEVSKKLDVDLGLVRMRFRNGDYQWNTHDFSPLSIVGSAATLPFSANPGHGRKKQVRIVAANLNFKDIMMAYFNTKTHQSPANRSVWIGEKAETVNLFNPELNFGGICGAGVYAGRSLVGLINRGDESGRGGWTYANTGEAIMDFLTRTSHQRLFLAGARMSRTTDVFEEFERVEDLGMGLPVLLLVKGEKDGAYRAQRLAAKQQVAQGGISADVQMPSREIRSDGFVAAMRLNPSLDTAAAPWKQRGMDPRAFAMGDGVAAVGFLREIRLVSLADGSVVRTIRHPKLIGIHALDFSKEDPNRLLVTSTATDRILEIDIRDGRILWEWDPWQHGYAKNKVGFVQVEKGKELPRGYSRVFTNEDVLAMVEADKNTAAPQNETWVQLIDFAGIQAPLGLESWQRNTSPNWAGYGDKPDQILATLYKTSQVVEIDRKTGRVHVLFDDLDRPHGVNAYGGRRIVSDTVRGRVLMFDSGFASAEVYRFAGFPTGAGDQRPIEWIQHTYPLNGSLLATVDSRRSVVYVWDPAKKVYSVYPYDPDWALQEVRMLPAEAASGWLGTTEGGARMATADPGEPKMAQLRRAAEALATEVGRRSAAGYRLSGFWVRGLFEKTHSTVFEKRKKVAWVLIGAEWLAGIYWRCVVPDRSALPFFMAGVALGIAAFSVPRLGRDSERAAKVRIHERRLKAFFKDAHRLTQSRHLTHLNWRFRRAGWHLASLVTSGLYSDRQLTEYWQAMSAVLGDWEARGYGNPRRTRTMRWDVIFVGLWIAQQTQQQQVQSNYPEFYHALKRDNDDRILALMNHPARSGSETFPIEVHDTPSGEYRKLLVEESGLAELFGDSAKAARLLTVLSLARRAYYEFNNNFLMGTVSPLDALVRQGVYFRISDDWYATPMTDSFRRHILFRLDGEGRVARAVELKIPGDSRPGPSLHEFESALDLHQTMPEDTIRPIAHLTFRGTDQRLHGRRIGENSSGTPITLMIYDYVGPEGFYDGRRVSALRNSGWFHLQSALGGQPYYHIILQWEVLEEAIRLIARMHHNHFFGSNLLINDMHIENFRVVVREGRIRLFSVLDTGAFYRYDGVDRERFAQEDLRSFFGDGKSDLHSVVGALQQIRVRYDDVKEKYDREIRKLRGEKVEEEEADKADEEALDSEVGARMAIDWNASEDPLDDFAALVKAIDTALEWDSEKYGSIKAVLEPDASNFFRKAPFQVDGRIRFVVRIALDWLDWYHHLHKDKKHKDPAGIRYLASPKKTDRFDEDRTGSPVTPPKNSLGQMVVDYVPRADVILGPGQSVSLTHCLVVDAIQTRIGYEDIDYKSLRWDLDLWRDTALRRLDRLAEEQGLHLLVRHPISNKKADRLNFHQIVRNYHRVFLTRDRHERERLGWNAFFRAEPAPEEEWAVMTGKEWKVRLHKRNGSTEEGVFIPSPSARRLSSKAASVQTPATDGQWDPREHFEDPRRPLELEIGIGTGDAIRRSAEENPGINQIGIDVSLLQSEPIRAALNQIPSLRIVHEDAGNFLHRLPPASLDRVRVLFPADPELSLSQAMLGEFSSIFGDLRRTIKPNGTFALVSEDKAYAGYVARQLRRVGFEAQMEPVPYAGAAGADGVLRSPDQLTGLPVSASRAFFKLKQYPEEVGPEFYLVRAIRQDSDGARMAGASVDMPAWFEHDEEDGRVRIFSDPDGEGAQDAEAGEIGEGRGVLVPAESLVRTGRILNTRHLLTCTGIAVHAAKSGKDFVGLFHFLRTTSFSRASSELITQDIGVVYDELLERGFRPEDISLVVDYSALLHPMDESELRPILQRSVPGAQLRLIRRNRGDVHSMHVDAARVTVRETQNTPPVAIVDWPSAARMAAIDPATYAELLDRFLAADTTQEDDWEYREMGNTVVEILLSDVRRTAPLLEYYRILIDRVSEKLLHKKRDLMIYAGTVTILLGWMGAEPIEPLFDALLHKTGSATDPDIRRPLTHLVQSVMQSSFVHRMGLAPVFMSHLRQLAQPVDGSSLPASRIHLRLAPDYPKSGPLDPLFQMLSSERELRDLLYLMTFMKQFSGMMQGEPADYESTDASETPYEHAVKNDRIFRFNPILEEIPPTQSFRRHIWRVADGSGGHRLIEVKIPGEMDDKNTILARHLTYSLAMGQDPVLKSRILAPIGIVSAHGRFVLYDKVVDYEKPNEPLRIMLFEYQDGKRMAKYPGGDWGKWRPLNRYYLESIARATGQTVDQVVRDAAIQLVVIAKRMLDLGYVGWSEAGNDFHIENFKLLPNGKVISINDFGAFRRAQIDEGEKKERIRDLTGFWIDCYQLSFDEIYAEGLGRLAGLVDGGARVAAPEKPEDIKKTFVDCYGSAQLVFAKLKDKRKKKLHAKEKEELYRQFASFKIDPATFGAIQANLRKAMAAAEGDVYNMERSLKISRGEGRKLLHKYKVVVDSGARLSGWPGSWMQFFELPEGFTVNSGRPAFAAEAEPVEAAVSFSDLLSVAETGAQRQVIVRLKRGTLTIDPVKRVEQSRMLVQMAERLERYGIFFDLSEIDHFEGRVPSASDVDPAQAVIALRAEELTPGTTGLVADLDSDVMRAAFLAVFLARWEGDAASFMTDPVHAALLRELYDPELPPAILAKARQVPADIAERGILNLHKLQPMRRAWEVFHQILMASRMASIAA